MPPNESTTAFPTEDEQRIKAFKSMLRSTLKFEEMLKARGIEIEYKTSPATGKPVPAFAKTDDFMANLLEHEDPEVQALASARLDVRSTIEETRGQRILDISRLPWSTLPDGNPRLYTGGTMPIPLAYGRAHTHRLAGDWKINMQNLPSGRGGAKSKLRKALIAPPGHKVIVADLAQIEARITAWICQQHDLLQQFVDSDNKRGMDPYAALACKIFSLTSVDKDSIERFIGKGGVLGLGFGCGKEKFFNMVLRLARAARMDMMKLKAIWTQDLASRAVDTYRIANGHIALAWRILDSHLNNVWLGTVATGTAQFGPVKIGHGYVQLPNDMYLRYGNPRLREGRLVYDHGGKAHSMYGAKLLENIVQALARIVVMNAALRIEDRTGYSFKLQAHDELAFIVPDAAVESVSEIIKEEMRRPPSWGKEIPLNCSCNHGQSYGDAK